MVLVVKKTIWLLRNIHGQILVTRMENEQGKTQKDFISGILDLYCKHGTRSC